MLVPKRLLVYLFCQALGVCLGLHDAKNAMVRTAADMTVRQIISLLFDRVADELGVTAASAADPTQASLGGGSIAGNLHVDDGDAGAEEAVVGEEEEEGAANGEGALRCAHLVFQVRLVRGCRLWLQ